VTSSQFMFRATLAMVLVCTAPVVRAQDVDLAQEAEAVPTVQEQVLLRGRNRAMLHPSDPLVIGGREQGDNEMRSGTSALKRGKTATGGVSGDDSYRRAIAMVESRTMFTTPPLRTVLASEVGTVEDARPSEKEKRSRAAPATKVPAPASSNMPWAIGGVVAAAVAFASWICMRNRS